MRRGVTLPRNSFDERLMKSASLFGGAILALAAASLALAAEPASVPSDPLAPKGALAKPAPAPLKPVTETLWGKAVTDNYRYMETLDPDTIVSVLLIPRC